MASNRLMTTQEIEKKVEALGPWFHNLVLEGVQTAPHHFLGDYPTFKWNTFQHVIPEDLTGMSVLDIGCNAGFYSIELKRRGAARVLGIDHAEDYLKQARFANSLLGLDIEFRNLSVFEVGQLNEKFDLVLFMGVFYHLRHPLLALDILRQRVVKDQLIFQSLLRGSRGIKALAEDYPFSEIAIFDDPTYPKMHFVEHCYSQDNTNWWIPNRAAAEAMLRSSGFRIEAQPDIDIFVCRVNPSAELHELPSGF